MTGVALVLAFARLSAACGQDHADPDGGNPDGGGADGVTSDAGNADAGQPDGGVDASWQTFTTTTTTLTVFSSEPLLANSPFFGIEVRKNGVDITDDIVNVESLSASSWRYTFGTEVLNTSGDTIGVSLQNRALAAPGHYVAVRSTVQAMYQLLSDCQAGIGACANDPPLPGLLASVKGMSRRYSPRDLEPAQGVHDFSAIFDDAAFLSSVGMKLHVMFTIKSFPQGHTLSDGDGVRVLFPVPAAWDKNRDREVHVYVDGEERGFAFNAARTNVVLAVAPPIGTQNVFVVYSRDPFPEYTWHLDPPVAGWFEGMGGPGAGPQGSHGFVHAPWRATCVTWMRSFLAAFQEQWTAALSADATLAGAIESVSVQETSNSLGGPGYSAQTYSAGLLEYAKSNARAVRRRAMFGQLFNFISGGVPTGALAALATAIIPWGARLEGPDLFNDEASLEDKVYQFVHRDQHDKALTMIWHQNDSYAEPDDLGGFYTPAQQFEKAQRGVTDSQTASGTPGLEAEYVFWNMTPSSESGQNWKDALPVIAANPIIQTSGNDRYLWRRASDAVPIGDQSLSSVNP
mgnify:CR=1 FL=1